MGLKMAYVRYADNFVVLSHSKEEAAASLEAIRKFIEESLHLRLNPEKEPIRSLEQGFVFLGVHFRGCDRFLAREKKDKIRRKLDWLTMKNRPHSPEKIIADLSEAIEGTRRYYGFLNPVHDFKDLDRYLLRRLRVLVITKRERGKIATKSDLHLLLEKLSFFAATEEGEARELRRQLVQDVFSVAERHAPGAKAASGRPAAAGPREPTPIQATAAPPTPLPTPSASTPAVSEAPLASKEQSRTDSPSQLPQHSAPSTQHSPGERSSDRSSTAAEERQEKAARSADRKVAAKKQRYVRRGFLESELVVSTPGTFMGHRSNRLVMYRERQKVFDEPLIKVKSILIHSRGVTVSSDLIEACAKREVPIVFSSAKGYVYASVHAPLQSRPELGLLQLDALRTGTALTWAKAFVTGKLKNQLNLLKFYHRHREDEDPEYAKKLEETEVNLEELQGRVRTVEIVTPYETARDKLFGFEGQAGVHYWEMVRLLLPDDIPFPGRVHRGAKDLVNASLNLGYSLLYPRIERALLMAGLNLYTSLLHAPQAGKPTLSFDLIEPFRAPVVDRAVFSLLTRGRDLKITGDGRLTSGTVQMIIEAVVGRLGTLVPYKGEKLTLEQVIYKQARLLAKSLRNEKRFKPFISRY